MSSVLRMRIVMNFFSEMNMVKKQEVGILSGVWAWLLERYPPGIIVIHALAYMTSISVSMFLFSSEGLTFSYTREGMGIAVFFMFPLILRIVDEHKDFEIDLSLHPNRVLQRGDTSLLVLRNIAIGCAILQLGFCLFVDGGIGVVTCLWGCTMLYALLMGKEFFCGAWLEKRMILYAISHQLITPISIAWFCSIPTTPEYPPQGIWGFALLCLLGTFSYEISRKIRAPEEEREGLDSYTKSLGRWQAPLLVLLLFTGISSGASLWMQSVGLSGGLSVGFFIVNGMLFALCILCCIQFIRAPKKSWAKGMEALSGVMTLWIYGWILYSIYSMREMTWIS
jgi:hypothetical protein